MESVENKADRESNFVAQLTECQLALRLYIRALMPGDQAVGDVIQQTNAKIWEKRSDFQPGTQFKAWAMAVARFEVLNYRKQQARDSRLKFSDELEETVAGELAAVGDDLAERQAALRECLRSLGDEKRELLMHRYGSTESLAEFAQRMGRSVGGMKVTLHRLRSALAECIERRLLDSGEPQ